MSHLFQCDVVGLSVRAMATAFICGHLIFLIDGVDGEASQHVRIGSNDGLAIRELETHWGRGRRSNGSAVIKKVACWPRRL